VKEVGWGFSPEDIRLLVDAGVSAIDVAGAGGTSWSQVEMHRTQDNDQAQIAKSFMSWGIPTAEAIINVRSITQLMPIFASGGLRSGLDIAKCIALGATLGGMANPFLKSAVVSATSTIQTIRRIAREIQICMFACSIKDIRELQKLSLIETK
jgi:isopentenyl-diphosphate delta-isomerase